MLVWQVGPSKPRGQVQLWNKHVWCTVCCCSLLSSLPHHFTKVTLKSCLSHLYSPSSSSFNWQVPPFEQGLLTQAFSAVSQFLPWEKMIFSFTFSHINHGNENVKVKEITKQKNESKFWPWSLEDSCTCRPPRGHCGRCPGSDRGLTDRGYIWPTPQCPHLLREKPRAKMIDPSTHTGVTRVRFSFQIHSPVHSNFFAGVVSSSLPSMKCGLAQRAMPGSLYPVFTQSDNQRRWQSQCRGLAPIALKKHSKSTVKPSIDAVVLS